MTIVNLFLKSYNHKIFLNEESHLITYTMYNVSVVVFVNRQYFSEKVHRYCMIDKAYKTLVYFYDEKSLSQITERSNVTRKSLITMFCTSNIYIYIYIKSYVQ